MSMEQRKEVGHWGRILNFIFGVGGWGGELYYHGVLIIFGELHVMQSD